MTDLIAMGRAAKKAGRRIATLTTERKNAALAVIADEIEACQEEILAANALDIADGRVVKAQGTFDGASTLTAREVELED